MAYNRGSSEDWDRYASISGGWSWNFVQQYFRKVSHLNYAISLRLTVVGYRTTQPADHYNTTGQLNPAIHSSTGINKVSLSGFAQAPTAARVIQITQSNPDEFPFKYEFTEDVRYESEKPQCNA